MRCHHQVFSHFLVFCGLVWVRGSEVRGREGGCEVMLPGRHKNSNTQPRVCRSIASLAPDLPMGCGEEEGIDDG
jgi:hypothetical protein